MKLFARNIHIIFVKELTDILRDRRTLISMILVPILIIPLLMGGVSAFMTHQMEKAQRERSPIILLGAQNGGELVTMLRESESLQVIETVKELATALELLQEKTVLSVINLPENFLETIDSLPPLNPPQVTVFFDKAEMESDIAMGKIKDLLGRFRNCLIKKDLAEKGISQRVLEPFKIEVENVASEEKMGGLFLGMILPYLVILLSITGAMYPAMDLSAGEKERGTLETLLVSSASRAQIVVGKFLTVLLSSVVTALLAVISLTVTLGLGLMGAGALTERLHLTPSPLTVLVVLLLMVPLAAIFSALLLTLSTWARSYREAQTYVSPLMILAILPAMISVFPGVEIESFLALVPIVNVSLILKHALMGNFLWEQILIAFASTVVYAALALWIAVRIFQKESVLFRT